jgi:predicted aminopeptidase
VKRWWWVAGIGLGSLAALLGAACLTVGCSTLGYYAQSVGGHPRRCARAWHSRHASAASRSPS